MTSGARERGDSLHVVVMDAHKALNALQTEIASESVDGASTYGLAASDIPRVRAFMRGLHRTAPLKFEHPGLGTTATRVGDRLVLQNDIGTTDAHVLVIHVEDLRVTLTYTDVHLQRLLFFQNLFERWNVDWEDTRSRRDDALEDGVYHLSVGTFTAADERELQEYLAFLGSRLVFLIDWNKARKRLRAAGVEGGGHSPARVGRGARLRPHGVPQGRRRAARLRCAGLRRQGAGSLRRTPRGHPRRQGGRGVPALRAQDLRGQPRQGRTRIVRPGRRPRASSSTTSGRVSSSSTTWPPSTRRSSSKSPAESATACSKCAPPTAAPDLRRNADRAKEWERLADALVNRARADAKHAGSSAEFLSIVESADDIADEFEEAAFHLTLIPAGAHDAAPRVDLQALGELLVQSAQEYVKVIETARHVRRGGAREDMQDFLEATHRIMALEHQTDEAHRAVEAALAAEVSDFRLLHVLTETSKNLEQAADALMHTSLRVRDYVIGQVMAA